MIRSSRSNGMPWGERISVPLRKERFLADRLGERRDFTGSRIGLDWWRRSQWVPKDFPELDASRWNIQCPACALHRWTEHLALIRPHLDRCTYSQLCWFLDEVYLRPKAKISPPEERKGVADQWFPSFSVWSMSPWSKEYLVRLEVEHWPRPNRAEWHLGPLLSSYEHPLWAMEHTLPFPSHTRWRKRRSVLVARRREKEPELSSLVEAMPFDRLSRHRNSLRYRSHLPVRLFPSVKFRRSTDRVSIVSRPSPCADRSPRD